MDATELQEPPLAIGVMGAASGEFDPAVTARACELGRAVARRQCTLITGACPGYSYAAVEGAKQAGGRTVGISPALSRSEHVERYGSPVAGFDLLVYTGSGLMGREVVNIRTSDIVVIIGGRSGTLGEFSIAYDEGRLIGVLHGSGGMADMIGELVDRIHKDTGAVVIEDADPDRLIARLVDYYEHEHYKCPSTLHDVSGERERVAGAGAG